MLLSLLLTVLVVLVVAVTAHNDCVWATGQILCKKSQKLVMNATVELYDRDGVFEVGGGICIR
jgi:hypothetical protein